MVWSQVLLISRDPHAGPLDCSIGSGALILNAVLEACILCIWKCSIVVIMAGPLAWTRSPDLQRRLHRLRLHRRIGSTAISSEADQVRERGGQRGCTYFSSRRMQHANVLRCDYVH